MKTLSQESQHRQYNDSGCEIQIKMINHEKKKRNRRKIEDYVKSMGMFNMKYIGQRSTFPKESVDAFLYLLL
jgi:hypothetical protein